MLLVDDLAAGGTKNLRHTPRGLVTLIYKDPQNACYQNYTNCSIPLNKLVIIIVSVSTLKRLQSFSKSA